MGVPGAGRRVRSCFPRRGGRGWGRGGGAGPQAGSPSRRHVWRGAARKPRLAPGLRRAAGAGASRGSGVGRARGGVGVRGARGIVGARGGRVSGRGRIPEGAPQVRVAGRGRGAPEKARGRGALRPGGGLRAGAWGRGDAAGFRPGSPLLGLVLVRCVPRWSPECLGSSGWP